MKPEPNACPSATEPNKLHDDIQKLVDEIAPYIYGETPMCKYRLQLISAHFEFA